MLPPLCVKTNAINYAMLTLYVFLVWKLALRVQYWKMLLVHTQADIHFSHIDLLRFVFSPSSTYIFKMIHVHTLFLVSIVSHKLCYYWYDCCYCLDLTTNTSCWISFFFRYFIETKGLNIKTLTYVDIASPHLLNFMSGQIIPLIQKAVWQLI